MKTLAIFAALAAIVATSYVQLVKAYPRGGGAYDVTKTNIGIYPGLLAGSTLVGLSRLETDSHYLSQIILGWWMAYIATDAVHRTSLLNAPYRIEPLVFQDGFGLGVGWRR